jgi:hypothetical protein
MLFGSNLLNHFMPNGRDFLAQHGATPQRQASFGVIFINENALSQMLSDSLNDIFMGERILIPVPITKEGQADKA